MMVGSFAVMAMKRLLLSCSVDFVHRVKIRLQLLHVIGKTNALVGAKSTAHLHRPLSGKNRGKASKVISMNWDTKH